MRTKPRGVQPLPPGFPPSPATTPVGFEGTLWMFRSLSFLFAVLLALAAVAPPASAADAVEASAATSVGASTSIGAAVKPFLRKHCFDCHGDSDGEAGINLASFPDRIETAEEAAGWLRVLEQVQADRRFPISNAIDRRVFLDENFSGSAKAEACAGTTVE